MPDTISSTIAQEAAQASAPTAAAPTPEDSDKEYRKKAVIDKTMNYMDAYRDAKRLLDQWKTDIQECETRRKTRDVDLDVEQLRQSGDIDEDETLIPVRVIDTNIVREQPPYINYLKNSRRLAIFKSWDKPDQDTALLEEEFTRGMTYEGWEKSYFKCIDGCQTHGWDCVEVVFDETKPYHTGLEHINHDSVIFSKTVDHIQNSPQVLRAYDVTVLQLRSFVDNFGFDVTQVNVLIDKIKDTTKQDDTVRIWKRYTKLDGVVHVAWLSISEGGCQDFLKKPVPLYLGIDIENKQEPPLTNIENVTSQLPTPPAWKPAPISIYPIFFLPYRETEKPKLTDHKGRVYLDENKQEAQTAVLSGFVNGLTRAARVYGSPAADDGTGSSLKELSDLKLSNSSIVNKPFNFWHPDYPDPMVLSAMKYFDNSNAAETNQVNFAAMNREDSRKTAKEITSSEQQQSLLNSVQLTLFSTFVRGVLGLQWLIVQSQAMQGKIKFLLIKTQVPKMNPVMPQQPMVDPQTGQPVMEDKWVNNMEVIGQTYDVRAAGDVDVIQRQELEMKMQQDWPVMQGTPAATIFLSDLMKLRYPSQGEKYAAAVGQQDVMQGLKGQVSALATVLQGVMKQHPDIFKELSPETQQQLQQILETAKPTLESRAQP